LVMGNGLPLTYNLLPMTYYLSSITCRALPARNF
jgi:hypothetical protein